MGGTPKAYMHVCFAPLLHYEHEYPSQRRPRHCYQWR